MVAREKYVEDEKVTNGVGFCQSLWQIRLEVSMNVAALKLQAALARHCREVVEAEVGEELNDV